MCYLHRTNRYGYKAGALDEGLKSREGRAGRDLRCGLCAAAGVADAGGPPLCRAGKIGMVQTRWTHLNRNYSFMTQVEAILLDGHFVLEHGGRSRAGVFFNFNGTAGMWRRRRFDEAAAGSTTR
jgi:hypothetical protein